MLHTDTYTFFKNKKTVEKKSSPAECAVLKDRADAAPIPARWAGGVLSWGPLAAVFRAAPTFFFLAFSVSCLVRLLIFFTFCFLRALKVVAAVFRAAPTFWFLRSL
jgi:hypothetical protein